MKRILKFILTALVVVILSFLTLGIIHPAQEYAVKTTINAPVSKVFTLFNDTTRLREWMPTYVRMENISGQPHEVGSKWKLYFEENGNSIEMTETVTAFKENELFFFALDNEVMHSENEVRFTPAGNQT